MNSDDIGADKTIISILEIQGIKFTSRNFQIEIELKQAMVVSPDPFLDECVIRKPVKKQQNDKIDLDILIDDSVKENKYIPSRILVSLSYFFNLSAVWIFCMKYRTTALWL